MANTWWHDQAGRYPLLTAAQEIQLGQAIRAWLDHPPPPPAALERSGRRARERFIRSNLRLVLTFAERYRNVASHAMDDLHQAGNEGLIRAVEKYDPTRGYKFSTYAYWWIRQAINAHLEQNCRAIRLPVNHSLQFARIQAGLRQLKEELNRTPRRSEIAERIGMPEATVERVIARPSVSLSLDESIPWLDDAGTVGDAIADPVTVDEHQRLELEQLEAEIRRLPGLTQRVVERIYISGDSRPILTLMRQEGLSRAGVSQQLAYGLAMLRKAMAPGSVIAAPPLQKNPAAIEHMEQLVLPLGG